MSAALYPARIVPLALNVLPALATLLLHAALLWLLLGRWEGAREQRVIEARRITPQIINARLVLEEELKAKPQPRQQRTATPQSRPAPQRPAPAREQSREATRPQSTSRARTEARTEPAPRPKAEAPAPASRPSQSERPAVDTSSLAAQSRRELAGAIAAEEAAEVAVSAEQMVASYAALIQRTVIGYWSRPPSARNGMQALLSVQLIPTGEVISVSVLESSGSAAFDRSAINAVEKAGSFPELRNLPAREFEASFRRFRLLFRPEDLRY